MNKVFTDNGWADYVYWQTEDRKTLKKINQLIEDICRNGNEGIGKPEPLSSCPAGFFGAQAEKIRKNPLSKPKIIVKVHNRTFIK